MDSDEDEYACAALVAAVLIHEKNEKNSKQKQSKWVNGQLSQQENKDCYGGLFLELYSESEIFKQYLRIPQSTFQLLLERVRPIIEKQDTHLRAAIPAGARLEATLLYLVTGVSYSLLKSHTLISTASLSSIIPETCCAIYLALNNDYMKVSWIITLLMCRI